MGWGVPTHRRASKTCVKWAFDSWISLELLDGLRRLPITTADGIDSTGGERRALSTRHRRVQTCEVGGGRKSSKYQRGAARRKRRPQTTAIRATIAPIYNVDVHDSIVDREVPIGRFATSTYKLAYARHHRRLPMQFVTAQRNHQTAHVEVFVQVGHEKAAAKYQTRQKGLLQGKGLHQRGETDIQGKVHCRSVEEVAIDCARPGRFHAETLHRKNGR